MESENQKLKEKKEDLENSLQIKNLTIADYLEELKYLESENQEKDEKIANITKQFEDSQNNEKDLKRKLDKVNQKLEKQKTKKLKVFEGETLDTVAHPETDLSKYGSFPNLKELAIGANQLSDILRNKPDLSKVTNLILYDSAKNPLDPIELINLLTLTKNVKILDLRKNLLGFLPKEIFNLQDLEDISLGNNNLTKLPKEIGKLQNLKYLYLDYNNLTELPKEIGNLDNLEYLCLDDNNLTKIPSEIYSLPNLKELSILGNLLEKLSAEDFVSSNVKIYQ